MVNQFDVTIEGGRVLLSESEIEVAIEKVARAKEWWGGATPARAWVTVRQVK